MIRKWPAEHGRELHPKPYFLLRPMHTYLSATSGPNITKFDLCIYWVSVVGGYNHYELGYGYSAPLPQSQVQ